MKNIDGKLNLNIISKRYNEMYEEYILEFNYTYNKFTNIYKNITGKIFF